MTEEITIYVVNDNEAPSLDQDFSISEASSLNSVVATAVGNDPENTTISYSLSGGNDKFTIDNNGQITLTDSRIMRAIHMSLQSLPAMVFSRFLKLLQLRLPMLTMLHRYLHQLPLTRFENTAVGSTIATSTFRILKATLSFSLSGTGSTNFLSMPMER